ncbi:MAG TPA: hypothetical protein VGC56_10370 [Allosphingosinicella sp.]|jgi:hypothetical protein
MNRPIAQIITVRMRRRRVIGLLAALASVPILSGCGLAGNSISYRYRMTVEVDTPEGLKRGSSVIQVDESKGTGLGGSHIEARVTGDAVVVDLPGGQTLFALLDRAVKIANCGAPPEPPGPNDPDQWRKIVEKIKARPGTCDLPRMALSPFGVNEMENQWPTLVRFGDVHDPRTLERVDPDNAEAALGSGVRITRITVQMTNDPVTTGIEKRLGWLNHLEQYRTDKSNPFTENLPKGVGDLRMKGEVV